MPETKKAALARAKEISEHFIAPLGVTSSAGKKVYAECRTQGECAAISHTVDKKARKKG